MFEFLKGLGKKTPKNQELIDTNDRLLTANNPEELADKEAPQSSPEDTEILNLKLHDVLQVIRHLMAEKQPVPLEILEQKLSLSQQSLTELAESFQVDPKSAAFSETLADAIEEFLLFSENPEELDGAWNDLEDYQPQKSTKIFNSQTARALLVAAVLGGKSLGTAAQEVKATSLEAKTNAISLSTENTQGLDYVPDKTINWNEAKELQAEIQELKDASQITIANYFETNSPKISEQNELIIKTQVNDFLNKLNIHNLEKFINSNQAEIFVSSDPRETNYANDTDTGNKALSNDRASSIKNIVMLTVGSYNFEEQGFSSQQAQQIKDFLSNDLKIIIPENGILNLNQVTNPLTGQVYSEAEINNLQQPENNEAYLKALQSCRVAKLSLMQIDESNPFPELNKISGQIAEDFEVNPEIKTNLIPNLKPFIDYTIFFDGSPSMGQKDEVGTTKEALAKDLEKNYFDKNITINIFTDQIVNTMTAPNTTEAAKQLRNIPTDNSSCDEKAFDVLIDHLKSLPNIQKGSGLRLFSLATDEPLYYATLDKMREIENLANKKGVEINFLMARKNKDAKKLEIITPDFKEIKKVAEILMAQKIENETKQLQERIAFAKKMLTEEMLTKNPKNIRYKQELEHFQSLLNDQTERIINQPIEISYSNISKK